jgi:hypothetical protein
VFAGGDVDAESKECVEDGPTSLRQWATVAPLAGKDDSVALEHEFAFVGQHDEERLGRQVLAVALDAVEATVHGERLID